MLGLVLALGCSESPPSSADPGPGDRSTIDGDGAREFVSDVAENGSGPASESSAGAAGAAASAPATPGAAQDADASEDGANRAIAEADIIQLQGDRLFALSAYSGLTVIDVSNPARLRVLGRYKTSATPFEMYLQGDIAYVMFNGYYNYVVDEESGSPSWVSSARLQALDVGDPARIALRGDHEVVGQLSDSRLVGHVLYLVTYEDGYCWRCEKQVRSTRVATFDIADPDEFPKVDELSFKSDENSYGPRSISVTNQRMYVAGPSWTETAMGSTIQVVDISDAGGKLTMGAEVPIAGRIDNRWQMDEFEGVLRVISQAGGWRSQSAPVVETFRIEGSDELTALGSLTMTLPRPEDLQSVRFDGTRAYAITFERKDPLFTLDLSDPSQPLQVGELEIPGFVYHMEPRGDRVYALGFDNANEDGGMHVSIFDVSDLAQPVMLDRVNFGGEWAHAVEDQDRIHKTFNLMLDRGLILLPFAGGTYTEANCDYRYQSGIQIIDVDGDDLTLRGAAPQLGMARRAILHRDALIGVSDDSVQSFDISDRDHPAALDKLEVARNIQSLHLLGDRVLRYGNDWWTDRALIDFTTKADANAVKPSGELDLSQVLDGEPKSCGQYAYFGDQVLVHGETAYIARYTQSWGVNGDDYQQTMQIQVLDISSDTPNIVSEIEVEPVGRDEWMGSMVLTDKALLVGRGYYRYQRDADSQTQPPRFYYDIFSLEDPRAPSYVERFEVPGEIARGGFGYGVMGCGLDMGWGWWYGGYDSPNTLVDGDLLISQHEEPLDDDSGRVRYYLDRLDLSDPSQPRMLEPINIPGKVVHFDGEHGVIVTLEDELREVLKADGNDCYWRGSRVNYGWDEVRGRSDGTCRVYDRILNSLRLEGAVAHRVSRVNLDEQRNSQSVAVSADRVFVLSVDRVEIDPNQPAPARTPIVHSFAVDEDAALHLLGETALEPRVPIYYGFSQLSARGQRAFIQDENRLHVVTAPNDDEPSLVTHDMPGWRCESMQVDSERVWCAMGKQGVLSFDL